MKDIEYAETMALKAVQFILADNRILENFVVASGILPEDFRNLIKTSDFLAGVLDFLLDNEEQLIEFCSQYKIAPDDPAKARRSLPGAIREF
jgi:hypothetical protein